MTQPRPLLEELRVIDLTRILAGPYCTQMLGDLGAEVIKVEAPGKGDDTRGWGPPFAPGGESAYFIAANRNKRSITLNLKSEAGRALLAELISVGDVLIENFRTGTLARWGFDYERLQELRPGLIYCTITGYGYEGPYAERPGYDFMAQALGGFMSLTGPADGAPHRAGVAIADLTAGMNACNAILAALFARERTGRGQRIDISLLESQIGLLSYIVSNYLISGERPRRYGNGHPNLFPYDVFEARDQYFALAVGNETQWAKFCEAIGRSEWVHDPRFATNAGRVQNRAQLRPLLDELFLTRDAEDWMAFTREIGIPSAPINSMEQVFADPHVQAIGVRMEVEHPTAGVLPLARSPLNVVTAPPTMRYPPPLLGQHTDEVLRELLGYDEGKLAQLREVGAI